jgi:putative nucleotidyltransferase with HDIG domain
VQWPLLAAFSAGALLSLFACFVFWRLNRPLRRLARTMSAMAWSGELQSDFESAGGTGDVKRIEDTFRALVVSLEESQRARERSYVEAVGAVVTAADARDQETGGHSFRVALYARELARTLGYSGESLKAIEWGALLHDVGKLVVPDDILRKVGPLDEAEWRVMRQHPGWGYEMLADVSFLQAEALDIVYSHHERWDGSGYPDRLAGLEIPLGARVFAIADALDAMTSDRPYRAALGWDEAVAEIASQSARQFDPEAVDAFREQEPGLRRIYYELAAG